MMKPSLIFGTRGQDTVQHKPTQINRPYHGFDRHFDK